MSTKDHNKTLVILSECFKCWNLSLMIEGEYEEALTPLNQTIDQCQSLLSEEVKYFPALGELFFASTLKAKCLFKVKGADEAFGLWSQISTHLTSLQSTNPDFGTVWDLLIHDGRRIVIEQVALSQVGLAARLFGDAQTSRRHEAFDEALRCADLAISIYENIPATYRENLPAFPFAEALFNKAYCAHELSDTELAIDCYNKAIDLFNELLDQIAAVERSFKDEVHKFDAFTQSMEKKLSGNTNSLSLSLLRKGLVRTVGKVFPVELFESVMDQEASTAIARAHQKYGQSESIRDLISKAWGNMLVWKMELVW